MSYEIKQENVYHCKCERCSHKWKSQKGLPVACSSCKTRSWNLPLKKR